MLGVKRAGLIACAWMALTMLVSGCLHRSPNVGLNQLRIDTLWYATSRKRTHNRLTYRLADSLEYGWYRITSRTDVDPMRDGLDIQVIDSARVTQQKFLTSVAASSGTASDVVVLSVHGYATTHSKAIRDAAEAYVRSGTRARWVAFSWPSNGRGMQLLQPGRFFLTSAYRGDSIAAVRSKPAFAQLLLKLHAAVGGSRLVVVTHSLGAQLATESLAGDTALRMSIIASPIRAIGLFEPDLPSKRFADFTVPKLLPTSRRIALYASTDDGMLRFSSIVNRGGRAGLLTKAALPISGIETIDVTGGESSEDWFRRSFGTHHAMKRETGALRDFFDVVVAGRKPSCRLTAGTAELRADSIWHLLPARVSNLSC